MQAVNTADVTVAVPTYNGSRHLAETLRSIAAQNNSVPIIISDDRSDDDTVRIAHDVAGDRVRVFLNTERLGLAGNWNRCVKLSDTPFVAIVHQDDLLRPRHLARHSEAIATDPSLGLIASATATIDENGHEVPAKLVDQGGLGPTDTIFAPGEALRLFATANALRCSAVTINATVHAQVGGFDPSFRYVLDWDYWMRVARSHGIAWIAEATVDVRWHVASETHRFARGTVDLEETTRLLNTLHGAERERWPDAAQLRRSADHRLARAYLNRAHVALRAGDGDLPRRALRRALSLKPGLLAEIVLDPRLAVQVAALTIAPQWAARIFKRT